MRRALFAAACLLAVGANAHAASSPQATVEGFYGLYGTFHPSDGIPDEKARAALARFLSPGLMHLLGDAAAAETRFASKYKDAPPLLEGDLFTSNFEGATSWTVRKCDKSGAEMACVVGLSFDPKDGKNKQVAWTDRLYLTESQGDWRIDDVAYGASWPFGNKGRLSDTLKEAVGDSGS